MGRKIWILVLVLLSLKMYGQSFVKRLDSKADFDRLSGLPLAEKYGDVSAIKLVYELSSQTIYYIHSKNFRYHHDFCNNKLDNDFDLDYFNKINYSNNPNRKYLLANINYYKSLDVYALEISPVDMMTREDIELLWNVVSGSAFIGDRLRMLLNTSRLQNLKSPLKGKVPTLNPSDVYRSLKYQAISKHSGSGVLHFINDLESEKGSIKPTDIIVIKETPLVLPNVAGVIVNEFQTPLSHLSILGQNRKIPICAYKKAFQDASLMKLNHKKVCIEVSNDSFKIYPVNKIAQSKPGYRRVKLKYDIKVDSILGIEKLGKNSYKYVGYKASNFGVLYQISKRHTFKLPECAFAIPFHFYQQHIQRSESERLISQFIADKGKIQSPDSLKRVLKNIRKAILSAPLDTVLLQSITQRVARSKWTRMRFRSSTNAEDAEGFSGAGLYASKTGVLNDSLKTFEKAIKDVWASLWSYEAYTEREYFNIDHRTVYMGILVHRSFPDEAVNGVAITKNLSRPGTNGFVVNAQLGNENVVKPKPGNVSDQFICFPNNADPIFQNKNTVDIITQSSLNGDKLVMTEKEIQNLANQLELIKRYFFDHFFMYHSYLDLGLDVEFKLEGKNRELYIKQVRIFND